MQNYARAIFDDADMDGRYSSVSPRFSRSSRLALGSSINRPWMRTYGADLESDDIACDIFDNSFDLECAPTSAYGMSRGFSRLADFGSRSSAFARPSIGMGSLTDRLACDVADYEEDNCGPFGSGIRTSFQDLDCFEDPLVGSGRSGRLGSIGLGSRGVGLGNLGSRGIGSSRLGNIGLGGLGSGMQQSRNINHQLMKTCVVNELIEDRQRDRHQAHLLKQLFKSVRANRNRNLIVRAIAAGDRVSPQQACHLLCADWVLDHVTGLIINRIFNDKICNRNADQILCNLSTGRTHISHPAENIAQQENAMFDCQLERIVNRVTSPRAIKRLIRSGVAEDLVESFFQTHGACDGLGFGGRQRSDFQLGMF